MTRAFDTVYSSHDGASVRLEASEQRGADGTSYRTHRLVVAEGRTGAVILASCDGRLLLVQSHRIAAEKTMWELPRGMGERGESATETALRELAEETGLKGSDPSLLGSYITDSSLFPQPVAVIACTVDSTAPRTPTDGEIGAERWVEARDLRELVRSGAIHDAHSLAAICLHLLEEPSS